MTIKSKLFYVFATTLLLFSISVASFFIVINNFKEFAEIKIGNSIKEAELVQLLLNQNHELMLKVNEVLLVAHEVDIAHESLSPQSINNYTSEMIKHTSELEDHIRYCQLIYKKDDSELKQFLKLENSIIKFTDKTNLFFNLWLAEKNEDKIFHYYQENIHSQAKVNAALLTEQYNRSLNEVLEQQENFKSLLINGENVIAACAVIIFILIFILVYRNSKSISSPLGKLKEQALAISNGDYDVRIKITSDDEISELAEAFNYMAVTISEEMEARKLAEDAHRRSQKMDAIGQLTGGIAHDFNNILAVILGNLEILELQITPDDDVKKRMEAMRKAGQRAADLTKQLLSFSRSQATQLTITNINNVITEMEALISHSLTPEVEVEHHFADDLWLTEIDPGDFKDVLVNLSINARDAMSGHGHLCIETRNTSLDDDYCAQNIEVIPGRYVELSVSDNGEGISEHLQEHIFEPFFSTKEQGKGTGLGLAMVYGFVKRSGGHIKVYSESGVGTTFRLYLPRVDGEEEPLEQNDEHTEELPRGNETILAVDDEAMLLELTRESLESLGYRVLTAGNGNRALELFNSEPDIDLLFSDVVMPGGINGYELAEQVTAKRSDIKILLTSGYTEKVMIHKGYARFNENLLSKPYKRADLAKRVRVILDS